MKTILHNALIAGASLALVATVPSVAQTAAQSQQSQAQSGALPSSVVRGKKLDNAKVFTTEGEQMGTIEDVLIDPKTGQVSHAVLGIGGWLGIGEKRVIVPWQLVQQDPQHYENFIVNADKEKLKGAPSFEGDQWATVTQGDYLKRVQSYFGLPVQQHQPQSGGVAQQPSSQQGQQAQTQQDQQKQQAQQARQQANQQAQDAARQAQQQADQARQQAQQAQQRAQQAEERAKQAQQAAQQTQQQQQQGGQVGTPQQ